jgi:DNA-damage-inducible protein J
MASITVQSRISAALKEQADIVFENMGMSIGDAIRIFIQQSVNVGGLPFQPSARVPGAETLAAFQEIEQGKATSTSLRQLRLDMGLVS